MKKSFEYRLNSKEKNINRLYKARAGHIRWMNSVKLLVSGLSIQEKIPLPLILESYFGKWYYNEALYFAKFNSQQVLSDIEALMESIFNLYTKIYSIYFGEKPSMLQTIFGTKTNVNKNDHILASKYYEEILFLSDQLKKKLAILERQLSALSLEKHEEIKMFDTDLEEESILSKTTKEKSYRYGARSH